MLGVVFIRRLALETLAALVRYTLVIFIAICVYVCAYITMYRHTKCTGAHAKVTHVWTFRDEQNPI